MGMLRAVSAAALVCSCTGQPVGRVCDLGGVPQPGEALISSPALDCVSRECLSVPIAQGATLPPGSMLPSGTNGLCTAECTQDSDCERVPESPCVTGFTCAIPLTVGASCCQKLCVCKDYLATPLDTEPAACDATDGANSCCNLAGRTNNPTYPACR
jgi:hypothetical protein